MAICHARVINLIFVLNCSYKMFTVVTTNKFQFDTIIFNLFILISYRTNQMEQH